MIALPKNLQGSKIATPNKAVTLKGVLPISSARNVMAKVKDTTSFIAAAIAVHGDRYDYSQTDYVGANMPIQIICRTHGIFTLSEPYTHVRQDRKCGCKKCTTEARKSGLIGTLLKIKTCKCGFTGHGKQFPQDANGECLKCYREKQDAKRLRIRQLRDRKCPVCGNAINSSDPRTVTCSAFCANTRNRVEKVPVSCCVCKRQIERYEKEVREHNCCSSKCQREWALIINRGPGIQVIDWFSRSSKARRTWTRKRRKERQKTSIEYAYWRISSVAANHNYEEKDKWLERCRAAGQVLEQRLSFEHGKKEDIAKTLWCEIIAAFARKSSEYSTRTEWSRKCYSTSKNMKWKRRLRSVRRNILQHTSKEEQPLTQLSLWEFLTTQPAHN